MTTFIDELVANVANEDGERPAVRYMDERITYGALLRRANAVAAQVVALGISPGDRVGVFAPKSIGSVATILGILRAGAAYVPLDPSAPIERVRFAMQHAGVKVLFVDGRPKKQCAKADPPLALEIVEVTTEELDEPPAVTRSGDDLAYILYTSGSTGTPKGVAITHRQSLAFVEGANQVFEIGKEDMVASHAPFNFDLSVIDLFCTFAGGAEVAIIPEKWISFPAKIAELIAAGISVWNSVPSALTQLVDRGGLDGEVSKLRLVMFAGEPIPEGTLRNLREKLPNATLMNVYGQTEANSSTYHVVEEIVSPLPIGTAFPNYEVLLLEGGAEANEGEIYVVSDAVARGYYGDEARTKKAFVPHPLAPDSERIVYKTGDRARRDEEGRLIFAGRNDDAFKVRGFRVELGEIEGVARKAGATDVAAVAIPNEEAGHEIHLFVIDEIPDLAKTLAKHLPKYMLPASIRSIDALPRTGTGKVDRRLLISKLAE